MKINKKTIDELCALSDDKLWAALRLFASSSGITLSSKRVSRTEMARIRKTLSELTEADISRAGEIIGSLKGKR